MMRLKKFGLCLTNGTTLFTFGQLNLFKKIEYFSFDTIINM